MYSFANDYSEIAHPKVLKELQRRAYEQNIGYGLDIHSLETEKKIKRLIKANKASVHFLPGGTITNLTFIASLLKPFEAVIAPTSGHINVHETGAIEATGHKIITCPSVNGKLLPQDIEKEVIRHCDEHMVKPKMVFISNATEVGTIYTKEEIISLSNVCKQYGLYLFLDGARLSNALAVPTNDLSLEDIAKYCDAFYLGGTKNGLLFGEALIIVNHKLDENFRYMIKQRGALTAKGFITALQFKVLLKDNLYLDLAANANSQAQKMQTALQKMGVKFAFPSPTNQIFPILSNDIIDKLKENYRFEMIEPDSKESIIRLVCSWATKDDATDAFIEDFRKLIK